MTIIIIRHADPDYSIDSLTETGWKEAELLSQKMIHVPAKAYYVSPLGRAKDTASLTLNKLGREAKVCDWLREFWPRIHRPDCPEREIISWDFLPQDWTTEPRFFLKDEWMKVPVMEEGHVGEAYQYVCDSFDALLAEHGYIREGNLYRVEKANNDTIVLFCHFGIECVMLSHLLNVSPMVLWHGFAAAPSSVTTIHSEERRKGLAIFRAASMGDISHLYAGGREPSFAARFCECYDNQDERHD